MMHHGIDMVYIPRFNKWLDYDENQLLTIFSPREVAELGQRGSKKAQFLASRFAVKEAFYKALSAACTSQLHIQPFGLRAIARFVEVIPDQRWQCPTLLFNAIAFQEATGIILPTLNTSVSLSHDQDYAIAQVMVGCISPHG